MLHRLNIATVAFLEELLAHECFVFFYQPVLIERYTISRLHKVIHDIPFLLLAEFIILVDLLKNDLWHRLVIWKLLLASVRAS